MFNFVPLPWRPEWWARFGAATLPSAGKRDGATATTQPQGGERMPAQEQSAIAAVTTLTLPLGSIYAFSGFLKPIEPELGIPRSALSLRRDVDPAALTPARESSHPRPRVM